MSLTEILEHINDYFWYIPLVLIVCLGIYGTYRLKGTQFRDFKEMFRVTFSKECPHKGKISTLQVFCISMGNRIGVGNISGPILAILVGGPGAILWMWLFALLGMASSLIETTVGQLYKTKDENGDYHGGPAYTILNG
ncbi:MAG: sodium:alanine symporter family protein, partial [Candidatus Methanomethylophilaceae archaeon]|nr:sodium:alanine symporter family protein [Candidatus Methanomethylophilaceae archaeon]